MATATKTAAAPRARAAARRGEQHLVVDGRPVKLTHLGKVLYPKSGFTKGQVIDYYVRVSPVMLKHLGSHPITLKRYPAGVDADFLYEKRGPVYRPDWVSTLPEDSRRDQTRHLPYCLVDGLPALIWIANLASIEMHALLANADDLSRPTMMVFDLDPGPGTGLWECLDLARLLRRALAALKLECFAKTSGGKGLHVAVPFNTPVTYEQTEELSRELARWLERRQPDRVTSVMTKRLRQGRVFVDWGRNVEQKTTVCAYSLRAKDRPTVSTPVSWDEIERAWQQKDASSLVCTADEVITRLKMVGDLFAPVASLRQSWPAQA